MRYPIIAFLISLRLLSLPGASAADFPATVQHAGSQPYILVPNNWRLRMVTNRLLEMGDDFAASHDVVNVQFAKQQLRIPRIAFDESPRRTNKQSGGILRWNEKTKSYDPFNGAVDARYLPFDASGPELTRDERITALDAEYFVYGLTPIVQPLAYAGQGLLNDPQNDVWIRDATGTTYFLDGNDWERVLKILVSEGQGSVSSLKPDLFDIQRKNHVALIQGIVKVALIGIVAGFAVLFALRWGLKRRSAQVEEDVAVLPKKMRFNLVFVVLTSIFAPGSGSLALRGWAAVGRRSIALLVSVPLLFLFFGPFWSYVLFAGPGPQPSGEGLFFSTSTVVLLISIGYAIRDRRTALRPEAVGQGNSTD